MLEFVYEFPREILGVKTPRELLPRGIHDEGHIVVIRRNLACITGLAICHRLHLLKPLPADIERVKVKQTFKNLRNDFLAGIHDIAHSQAHIHQNTPQIATIVWWE